MATAMQTMIVSALFFDRDTGLGEIRTVYAADLDSTDETTRIMGWGEYDGESRQVYAGPARGTYILRRGEVL